MRGRDLRADVVSRAIEGQQICLFGDIGDEVGDRADLFSRR
jgi:hypothetical protein